LNEDFLMKQPILFWLLAFVLTAASAIYQRVTGPTYPQRGSVAVGGNTIHYRLERTHAGETPETVRLQTGDVALHGVLSWRHHNSDEEWTRVPMTLQDNELVADLPGQPPAGKLDYQIALMKDEETILVPQDNPVVIRFRGDVPALILIVHISLMFGGMLLSTRTGMEFFAREPNTKKLILWTMLFLFTGGMILGPVVQWYAFGAFWTGWPFGHDLTDNKTAVALLAWIIAWYTLRRSKHPLRWALTASIITLAVFLVPHSVLGSELKYEPKNAQQPVVLNDSYSRIKQPVDFRYNHFRGA
jgi:hypothetical protein